MQLQRDLCSECCNKKNCCYLHAYDGGTAVIEEVLQKYKPLVEWYGTLKATCDYFVKDTSKEPEAQCCAM